jgi:excisionase family DNA binding protein
MRTEMRRAEDDLKLTPAEISRAFADPHWAAAFPPVLSVPQAAQLASVPTGTIYSWSSAGRLKGVARRVGKHLRIFRDRFVQRLFNEGIK